MRTVRVEIPDDKELVKDGDGFKLINKTNIMEKIKDFDDVDYWWKENMGEDEYDWLKDNIDRAMNYDDNDLYYFICAYATTIALNEGWDPKAFDIVYIPYISNARCVETNKYQIGTHYGYYNDYNKNTFKLLCFKTSDLAKYAMTQFNDIYKYFIKKL